MNKRFCCLLAVVLAPVLTGCAGLRLSAESPAESSYALAAPNSGTLDEYGDRVDARLQGEESAYWLLERSDDALSARLALTDEAVSSLDVQYFIWQPDETGRLLLKHLILAADRGVHIRLLLDDFAVNDLDRELAGLDEHPNIEVRVFNPWRHRKSRIVKAMEFLLRFRVLNHRMHNKVYVADNRFAIIGGRNIGNRYFGLYPRFVQNDLDLLISGPLVGSISSSFDLFWNCGSAYAGSRLVNGEDSPRMLEELRAKVSEAVSTHAGLLQAFPAEPADWSGYFDDLMGTAATGVGQLHYDLPFVRSLPPEQLYAGFREFIGKARHQVLISSPYFIPDRDFLDELKRLIARGVHVAILTNSLASNNHAVAHTGYKRLRKAVLRLGAELYELREDAKVKSLYATEPVTVSALGLHSKAAVVDGYRVFIGSPNVDPRSMHLNTELGVIVEDRELAARVSELISRDMDGANAWQVTLSKRRLLWTSDRGSLRRDPADGFRQRSTEFFLNLLPLKGQL